MGRREAKTNVDRHGVAFAEALTVFGDPLEVTVADPDHPVGEYRFLEYGYVVAGPHAGCVIRRAGW